MEGKMKIGGMFDFICYDGRHPKVHSCQPKWQETAHNVVTNAMMTSVLNIVYRGSGATALWYVGLMELTGAVTTADTMASHAGWKICNATYGGGATYPTWSVATAAGRQITNSANKAQFVMSGSSTIWGGFIESNSKKSSTTGMLCCVAQFTGASRGVAAGDTVEVTYSQSLDDDAA